MKKRAITYALVDCSLGRLLVATTGRGVCQVRFGDADAELEDRLRAEFPFAVLERNEVAVKPWSEQLVNYVDGYSTRLDIPLDVSGSRFQRRVWEALRRIPRGNTRSYSAVARSIEMPRAARAVARACATNPVAVVIPCHRVVAQNGIGGYAGGLERKRALLAGEARSKP